MQIAREFDQSVMEKMKKMEENLKSRNYLIEPANFLSKKGFDILKEMNSGGKHLRGTLVYLGYRMMSEGPLDKADTLAEAYELFQTAILVHDDVIDHASVRRKMETIHTRYAREFAERGNLPDTNKVMIDTGRSIAICLGDMGFYLVEEKLVNGYKDHPAFSSILSYYHRIVLKTIEGELLDVQLPCMERYQLWREDELSQISLEDFINDIYHLKTSYYTVIGPLCSGMLLGGASSDLLREMESIADDLGIAFQLQDDILGIYGEQKEVGKNIGADVSEYKQTLLYAYTKKVGGEAYERLCKYYGKPILTEEELRKVQDIFRECGALEYVEQKIDELFSSAKWKLEEANGITKEGKELFLSFMENHLMGRQA